MIFYKDITGQIFGRLTVLKQNGRQGGKVLWLCKCICGNYVTKNGCNLRNGNTKSCGCLMPEKVSSANSTHGKANTAEYRIWVDMRRRCYIKKTASYPNYGGRGISVCDRWRDSFANFLNDMGERPSRQHSLERIENDDIYKPSNCKWDTVKNQSLNRRSTVFITYKGKRLCKSDWAREIGINPCTFDQRLKGGWAMDKIINTPPQISGYSIK